MAVVTIARQLGAGGGSIAEQLAGRLRWRLLDRALVEAIAADLGVAADEVARSHERVETFIERLGQYLAEGFPEVLPAAVRSAISPRATARAASRVITRAAAEKPAVVVGHGAQCVLARESGAFHVLLHAPFEVRVERGRNLWRCHAEDAAARIRQSDVERRRYIREHFEQDWLNPALYHLCVDTSRLGVAGSVDVIARGARHVLGGQPGLAPEPEGPAAV